MCSTALNVRFTLWRQGARIANVAWSDMEWKRAAQFTVARTAHAKPASRQWLIVPLSMQG